MLDPHPGGAGTLRAGPGTGVGDQDRCSRRVTLRRHRSLRKLLRDRGQLSHFWKAHRLDMVRYSEDCAAFMDTNEPLINYLDVSTERCGVLSPETTLMRKAGPQHPKASPQALSCSQSTSQAVS